MTNGIGRQLRNPDCTYSSFADWRGSVAASGLLPIIIIAGSRGKTLVVKILESILAAEGLSVAARTSAGVDIRGIRQPGELRPWLEVERSLASGTIDIAIQEVDWATAVAFAPNPRIPVLAITNICGNRDECHINGDAKIAYKATPSLLASVADGGLLALNGEDTAVARDLPDSPQRRVLVGLGLDTPTMQSHFEQGGDMAWLDNHVPKLRRAGKVATICSTNQLEFALQGRAGFQVFNALMAAAIARQIAIAPRKISIGLKAFESRIETTPGSFNLLKIDGMSVILDGVNSSWFLRPILRALRDNRKARLLVVTGMLRRVPDSDLREVGRLLGRLGSIMLVGTGESDQDSRASVIIEGAGQNHLPPLVIQCHSELAALQKALSLGRVLDTVYCISDSPSALIKAIGA
jgi:cyanophycin synthetase